MSFSFVQKLKIVAINLLNTAGTEYVLDEKYPLLMAQIQLLCHRFPPLYSGWNTKEMLPPMNALVHTWQVGGGGGIVKIRAPFTEKESYWVIQLSNH